jgi:hypothetical protein
MLDSEKILLFEKYMRDKNTQEDAIRYNLLVVRLLVTEVLYIFNQNLENIDTYSFEEFTDMISTIDDHLGGREGIPKMLKCMQELTEFLKQHKLIKGGKIAYYKRMFNDTEYYIDKYDMMTGKKDDTKDFIKNILLSKFSSSVNRIVEDVNVFEFDTLQKIDKILNDVPFSKKEYNEEVVLIKYILIDLKLLEEKNGTIEATKKGRALSRLQAEDRYSAILYLMLFSINWINVMNLYSKESSYFEFKNLINIITMVFHKTREIAFDSKASNCSKEDLGLIEISTEKLRISRAYSMPYGNNIINICFIGMGLLDIEYMGKDIIKFKVTDLGCNIFKLMYADCAWYMRNKIESISYLIKNKKIDKAEESIIEFLSTYGGNTVVWDYIGQILLLKRNFKSAYMILKHAYENSSKQGKAAKSSLYHLVLCCRKLKLEEDMLNYEEKLKVMSKA